MGESIIAALLKILGWYLDYVKASDVAKRAYLNLITSLEPHMKSCVRLRESYIKQRNANLDKVKGFQ